MVRRTGPAARPLLRVGRKVGRTIYRQLGDRPSDSDPLIGLMDSAALAEAVVTAVNVAWELTEYFEAELAVDAGDSQAEWVLSLLRPIWEHGLAIGGAADLPPEN